MEIPYSPSLEDTKTHLKRSEVRLRGRQISDWTGILMDDLSDARESQYEHALEVHFCALAFEKNDSIQVQRYRDTSPNSPRSDSSIKTNRFAGRCSRCANQLLRRSSIHPVPTRSPGALLCCLLFKCLVTLDRRTYIPHSRRHQILLSAVASLKAYTLDRRTSISHSRRHHATSF